MKIIYIEPTSTMEVVPTAVKSTISTADKCDDAVEVAVRDISITSIWRLKNGQSVAKVSVPRTAKPTEVTRLRVGCTSCRFRIRRTDAIRCYKCRGFGYSQGSCLGSDLKTHAESVGNFPIRRKSACTPQSAWLATGDL